MPPPAVATRLRAEQLEDRANPGTGTFTGPRDDGQFNFAVSVRFNATAAQLDAIAQGFQAASLILADATDGKHRFGEVTIVNNKRAGEDADFWVFPGTDRANAPPDGYGYRGQHANLFFDAQFGPAARGGDYVIAHEMGHLAYGLGDSYTGPNIDANPNFVPVGPIQQEGIRAFNAKLTEESPTLSYSLMDDFFRRGGNHESVPVADREFTLNEFSVNANHDKLRITWQSDMHEGLSDWSRIAASRYPATPPAGLPQDAAPPPHTVTIRYSTGDAVVTAVIDRSGSMTPPRFLNAQTGPRLLTHFLGAADRFGVVSFSDLVIVDHPLALASPDALAMARAEIDQLAPVGGTDIHLALLEGIEQVKAVPPLQRSPNEVLLLLTDGDHTEAGNPLDLIPELQRNGISVIAIGVGPGLSPKGQSVLGTIARETNGYFLQANSDFEVLGQMFAAAMRIVNNSGASASPVTRIGPTEPVKALTATTTVEAGVESATFGLFKDTPDAVLKFTLVSPSGRRITAAGAGVQVIDEGVAKVVVVTSPEAGEWTAIVEAEAGSSPTQVQVRAALRTPGTALSVYTGLEDDPTPGGSASPIPVFAVPRFQGQPILGAKVAGFVTRPDGSRVPITLVDDGSDANGDLRAGDGVYSAVFSQFVSKGDGAYSFDVRLDTTGGGATVGGGESFAPGDDAPAAGAAVPGLRRTESLSVAVEGVPELPGGTVGGRVFDDANGNGRPDAGEAGVGGVLVYPDLNANGERDADEPFTFTNGDGTYRIDVTNPGNYLVRIVVPEGENQLSADPVAVVGGGLTTEGIDFALGDPAFVVPTGPAANGKRFVVGAGGRVSVRGATGAELFGFAADGGRVAQADFTGDGVPDIVVATGAGVAGRVRILDGATGREVFGVAPFEDSFTGGLFVAAGDVTGDGVPDLVVTPGLGGGPRVVVYSGAGFGVTANFFWLDDLDFRGGSTAAVADLNGDGVGDLVVGAGVGGGPRVAGLTLGRAFGPAVRLFPDFFAFEPAARDGVFVAAGGVGVVVGSGDGGGPRVAAFDTASVLGGAPRAVVDFLAGGAADRSGARVAVRDLDDDGAADLVVGAGNRVTGFLGAGLRDGTPAAAFGFDAADPAGVFVG